MSGSCTYVRYPEWLRIQVTAVSDPWKGECGFIISTSANDRLLLEANGRPEATCPNCNRSLNFKI